MFLKTLGRLSSAASTSHVASCCGWKGVVTQDCWPPVSWPQLPLSMAEASTCMVSEAAKLELSRDLSWFRFTHGAPSAWSTLSPSPLPNPLIVKSIWTSLPQKDPPEIPPVQYFPFKALVTTVVKCFCGDCHWLWLIVDKAYLSI